MTKSEFNCIVKIADQFMDVMNDAKTDNERRVVLVAAMTKAYKELEGNK